MPLQAKDLYTPKTPGDGRVGMIKTREPGLFSARLKVPVGILTAQVFGAIAELATTYGRGEVFLTTRLGIEIPGIREADFPALRQKLADLGVELAGCGPRMRSTVACKGTVCPHGNIDTFALAWEIDQKHNDGGTLPHKFKVTVGGCPSSCAKPQVNDVGLVGVAEPGLDASSCVGCGLCAEACQVKAIDLEDGLPAFDKTKCVACGDCARACPETAIRAGNKGIDLYAGGRWGREKQVGLRIARFLSEAEALTAVGTIKQWYAENGLKKERLGQTILRMGLKEFQRAVLGGIPPNKWVKLTAKDKAGFQIIR